MGIIIGDIALLPVVAIAPLAVAEVYGNEINGFKTSYNDLIYLFLDSPKSEEGVVPEIQHESTNDGDPGQEKDGTSSPPNIALLPSVAAPPTLVVVAEVNGEEIMQII